MNRKAGTPKLAFVFPGQGSQAVGMMAPLAQEFAEVGLRFERASQVLGFDLWDLVSNGPEENLNRTQNAQPAMLAASVATWDIWINNGGPVPDLLAGHSFGEYTALVCAGALDFETAVAVVADRGRFMQEAVPQGQGAMAAILGLELDAIALACAQASLEFGACACANLNAPGQIVIAGVAAAVDRACAIAAERGAKRAIRLPVSVPAHCALMRPAADRLAELLAPIALSAPAIRVIHNVDVETHTDADGIKRALVQQLYSPVRWIETIERFAAAGIRRVGECGPGKILSALIKRIDHALQPTSLVDGGEIRNLITSLREGVA